MKQVFITGGTGYMGKRLIARLVEKGHQVTALVRSGSEHKVPAGVAVVTGNPFDHNSFYKNIPANAVLVQLLGVPHPSPKKADQFQTIDLISVIESAKAAALAQVAHFIYVSVSMEPSGIMHAYQEVRKQGEQACIQSGVPCTFLRPWYVLGPGHYWPVLLMPVYWIAALIPSLRRKTKAFGLVTIQQMINSLVSAVESDPQQLSIVEITAIKRM